MNENEYLEKMKKQIPYYEIFFLFQKRKFEKYVSSNVIKFKTLEQFNKSKKKNKFENPFLFETHYDIPFHIIQNIESLQKYKSFFFCVFNCSIQVFTKLSFSSSIKKSN